MFFRDFLKIFRDLLQSRRAIHTMNTLYQNATLQELQAADFLCIICRENMTTAGNLKNIYNFSINDNLSTLIVIIF